MYPMLFTGLASDFTCPVFFSPQVQSSSSRGVVSRACNLGL